jgi:hypothetical protein
MILFENEDWKKKVSKKLKENKSLTDKERGLLVDDFLSSLCFEPID